jgi:hypothetical protein
MSPMSQANRRRAVTCCVLAAYLLVVTAAQRFHDHGGHGCDNAASECTDHPAHGGREHVECAACGIVLDSHRPAVVLSTAADDDCVVCQFLSHHSNPAPHFELPRCESLSEEARQLRLPPLEIRSLLPERSRAPPAID